MRNKGILITIIITVSVLCLFFLSFSFISQKVKNDAKAYASSKGQKAEVHYLDSIWDKHVLNIPGIRLTYKEIKEKELSLGLDLQGGIHMILEVSPADILTVLASNPKEKQFYEAIKATEQKIPDTKGYVQIFAGELKKIDPKSELAHYFVNPGNKDILTGKSSENDIISYLDREISLTVDRSFQILRDRIDRFGVANPNIQRLPGTNRIQVELAGIDNPERFRNLLKGMANLEFWQVWQLNELAPYLDEIQSEWIKAEQTNRKGETDELVSLLTGDSLELSSRKDSLGIRAESAPIFALSGSSYAWLYDVKDTAKINLFFNLPEVARLLPPDLTLKWGAKPQVDNGAHLLELYPLKNSRDGAILKGDIITNAEQVIDQEGPGVSMTMNLSGATKWKKITGQNIGKQIAIVMDNLVYSAPVVQSEIPNGHSSITGNFTVDEANDLANILNSGKIPVKIKIVEEAVVGPSLGKAAISQGLFSLIFGFSLVVIFMMVYYGRGGSVANMAVIVNLVWILGILTQFGATLTLPGIAGLVLTIGMAVDANVLIFERIREELKRGMTLSLAIKTGYEKAYSSILDSNITTFLTGLILFTFGTGGVRGFAIVLMIGVVCSVLSAVFVTRLILERMNKKKLLSESSFHTIFSTKLNFKANFDFVKYRKKAYLLSLTVILVGFGAAIYQKGYNFGVDFQGGRSYIINFDKPVSSEKVKESLIDQFGNYGLEVKTYNQDNTLKITSSYLIDDPSEGADEKVRSSILQVLEKFDQSNPQIIGSTKVGPAIADDFKKASWNAIIFSLITIFLYILIRFKKWQYSLGASIALLHDVLIIFAFYAIAGLFNVFLEIDQIFIAAVLTIIGYSINDTVVVFDRIREFSGKLTTKNEFKKAINPAINNTLSRTVITSLTVLIVVVVLLIFGGEGLKGFSVALLIGVIFGTYSSIFIASSIALDMSKKDKNIRIRKLPGSIKQAV